MERKEIIARLKKIAVNALAVGVEPYILSSDDGIAASEAVMLLGKQEPVPYLVDRSRNRRCPKCKTILKGRYCHECGQAVKMD